MLRLKAAGDTYLMNKFGGQNFAFATLKNAYILVVSGVIQLQRHCEMMEVYNGCFLLGRISRFMAML